MISLGGWRPFSGYFRSGIRIPRGNLYRAGSELGGRFIVGEMAAILDDFAQLHMQTFYGIGGVNHLPDFRCKGVERNDMLPGAFPGLQQRTNEPLYYHPNILC